MITKTTKLSDVNSNIKTDAFLTEFIIQNSEAIDPLRKRPAIVVCPGGGYSMVSDREGIPIALSFVAQDCSAFVLTYSVAPNRYPTQLLEVSAAISYIRENAEEYNIDKDKIIVIGFSAGGHLTASIGTLWNEKIITDTLKIEKGSNKPNGLILSYAVITSIGDNAHKGSFENLIGDETENKELFDYLSLENRVTADTMPTFLWHTANDSCVPVENSLLFASALQKNKVPFEMHIFPDGVHGLSLCNELSGCNESLINPHCERWIDLAMNWLKLTFK
jgi:acetyl esterase/lipase